MKINEAGLALIKSFEGCKLTAYKCPAQVWTIGYGSTGSHVKEGMTITVAQAEDLLTEDLARFEIGVEKLATVELNDNQFAALVSFAFNLGLKALEQSTLLRFVNEGKMREAAAEFAKWNRAKGKVLLGLTKRREAEKALFLKK